MGPCPGCEITDGKVTRKCGKCLAAPDSSGDDDDDLEGPMEVEQVDSAAALAKLAKVKRHLGTPSQSPSGEPPVQKSRGAELPAVLPFPKIINESLSSKESGQNAAPSSPPPKEVAPNPSPSIESMLLSLTEKMDSLSTGQKEMSTKMDGMASKKDLQELRKEVTKETKGIVSDAVHPLKSDLCEIRTRVAKLESAPIPGNSSAAPATMSAEVKSILDSLDPAHKQIVFSGFPEKLPHAERIKLIQNFLNGIPDTPPFKTSGIIYKGPRNNRQETKMSFIEYGSTDDARALLKKIKELPCILGGQNIKIKAGLTKFFFLCAELSFGGNGKDYYRGF